jgi:hypothetical protein
MPAPIPDPPPPGGAIQPPSAPPAPPAPRPDGAALELGALEAILPPVAPRPGGRLRPREPDARPIRVGHPRDPPGAPRA